MSLAYGYGLPRFLKLCRRSSDHVIGPNGILATKARIVVTNSIHFLKQFDQILYLRRGIVLETGSYQDLVNNSESQLYKLM